MAELGRKCKYYSHIQPHLDLVEGWVRQGVPEETIARKLSVAKSSFQEYKKKFPELSALLKKGRDTADIAVENALFRAAVGFEYEETHTEFVEGSRSGKAGVVPSAANINNKKVVTVKKQIPGNVTAQIFWLKNRRPDLWQDRKEIAADVSGSLEMQKFRATLDSMTPEQKMAMLEKLDLEEEV